MFLETVLEPKTNTMQSAQSIEAIHEEAKSEDHNTPLERSAAQIAPQQSNFHEKTSVRVARMREEIRK